MWIPRAITVANEQASNRNVLPASGTNEGVGGAVIALASSVTAPVSANSRPSRSVAPVFAVMEALARMFPSKAVAVPSVAELPICQKTFAPGAEPPLMVTTELFAAVVRAEPI